MKKVVLLYNYNRGVYDYETDFDCDLTIQSLKDAISKNYECTLIEADKDIGSWINKLKQINPDIVFNVTESYRGVGREAFCPILIEQLGISYTGPGPVELINSHNKFLTKNILSSKGILVPDGFVVRSGDFQKELISHKSSFPMIVKLNSEGSSMGMDENCIVKNKDELEKQIKHIMQNFNSEMLVEQYIEGRDISMTYIEGLGIMGPAEYVYPGSTIYDFRLKTVDNDQVIVKVADDIDHEINKKLFETTEKIVKLLDLNGYGRIDYRLSPDGEIYFLELNAQVSFHPDGAFFRGCKARGIDFDSMVDHILNYALSNKRRVSLYGSLNF